MNSIRDRFSDMRSKNESHGDYIIMCMVVTGMGYKPSDIKKAFKELVQDEGWTHKEKDELVAYLVELTDR